MLCSLYRCSDAVERCTVGNWALIDLVFLDLPKPRYPENEGKVQGREAQASKRAGQRAETELQIDDSFPLASHPTEPAN